MSATSVIASARLRPAGEAAAVPGLGGGWRSREIDLALLVVAMLGFALSDGPGFSRQQLGPESLAARTAHAAP
ncbi:MAG: hypothetical protein OXC08_18935 [Thiotrichales bacterium]|nr:hypothetical protein [Thiotrichales bacterium]